MIEGGGLGVFAPEEIGPSDVQSRNGVVDIAGRTTRPRRCAPRKQYLVVLPGPAAPTGTAPTSARCATLMPENRLRVYDVRAVIDDAGRQRLACSSCARGFGAGIDHRADPHRGPAGRPDRQQPRAPRRRDRRRGGRQGGALHAAVRRASTCRCCRCATRPGFMVGPEIESTRPRCATSAACSWSARTCACRSSPSCCARATGWARRRWRPAASTRRCSRSPGRPASSAPWDSKARCGSASARSSKPSPTGAEREALFEQLVAQQYENGKAINMAPTLEIDDVIDPAETRGLAGARAGFGVGATASRRWPYVDTW